MRFILLLVGGGVGAGLHLGFYPGEFAVRGEFVFGGGGVREGRAQLGQCKGVGSWTLCKNC